VILPKSDGSVHNISITVPVPLESVNLLKQSELHRKLPYFYSIFKILSLRAKFELYSFILSFTNRLSGFAYAWDKIQFFFGLSKLW